MSVSTFNSINELKHSGILTAIPDADGRLYVMVKDNKIYINPDNGKPIIPKKPSVGRALRNIAKQESKHLEINQGFLSDKQMYRKANRGL